MGPQKTDIKRVEYVQGDVFFARAKCPAGAKKINHRPLAYGEVTGHSHQVVEDTYDLYEVDGKLYLLNESSVTIKHEEHKPITLPPGEWEIGIVKEFDPFDMETRQVRD